MRIIKVRVEKNKNGVYWGNTIGEEVIVAADGKNMEELKREISSAFSFAVKDLENAADYADVEFEFMMDGINDSTSKQKLQDILLDITWAKISKRYFGKSSSWIYNKINGIDGNGGKGGFTDEESERLKDALMDFSDRIRTVAEKL